MPNFFSILLHLALQLLLHELYNLIKPLLLVFVLVEDRIADLAQSVHVDLSIRPDYLLPQLKVEFVAIVAHRDMLELGFCGGAHVLLSGDGVDVTCVNIVDDL